MKRIDYKIHIIGGGISGLIAAKTLEVGGYRPTIIEATDRVGGRVKTDIVDGFQLDHGFQVLLDAYPLAQKHLDYEQLNLQQFVPGAVLFKQGKSQIIGDPLRDGSLLLSTLLATAGSLGDKLKIFKLNQSLKKKSITSIFKDPDSTTLDYLKAKGFSDRIIASFFKPFFSGIFLEDQLQTSSRMFEFVYKLFGEGHAVLPESGIEAIPKQLKTQLKQTNFIFNTKIAAVHDDHLITEDGNRIDTHFTIIATEANGLISNLSDSNSWKSCNNLYFKCQDRTINKPIIGLVTDDNALINNIFFHNTLATACRGEGELLSVTVVKDHNLKDEELVKRVQNELAHKCNITNTIFLKHYRIPKALPDNGQLRNDCSPTETQLKATIFLAGDQLLNGSLNAAMRSGERAAEGLIMTLEDGLRVEELTSEYL